jgi:Zn-dependent alcohol dehydrogenase
VVMLFRASCGRCEFCAKGKPGLCAAADSMFKSGGLRDGTTRLHRNGKEIRHFSGISCFAEYAVVPEEALIKIDDDIPAEVAALLGCAVTTGIGAVSNTAGVEPGSSVLVIGVGGVGLSCVLAAKLAGAYPIITADLSDAKLDFSTSIGASHGINVTESDLVSSVREIVGDGVDYAFEAAGNVHTMNDAFRALRRGGTLVVVGVGSRTEKIEINPVELVFAEKTIKGSYYGSSRPHHDIPQLLKLYKVGMLPLDKLVGRRYRLDEVNEAYKHLIDGELGRGVLVMDGADWRATT